MIGDWQVTEAIDKIKAMKYFDIEVSIEKPFQLPKNMPFQLKFVDGDAVFRVLASSEHDAYEKIFGWLNDSPDWSRGWSDDNEGEDPYDEDIQ
tara:strand:- start:2443 stop:2721 length:279 start_codon:yes stop_codon:yes gene_type:complete